MESSNSPAAAPDDLPSEPAQPEANSASAKDPRYQRWRWTIFAITWLAYVGFYFTRKAWPVATVGILKDPNISIGVEGIGLINMGYGVAYAMGQFFWGMCADKLGSRIVVLIGMFFSVVAAVAMGASSILIFFGLFFFIQGLCQSSGWAPLTKNVGYWFSRKERGRVYGVWATNYAVGGMLATAFAGQMAWMFGSWRFALFMSAAVLAVIWLLFLLFQRNRPEDVGLPSIEDYHGEAVDVIDEEEQPEEEPEGSWAVILDVLKNPVILTLGLIYFFLKPTRYAILFWGPQFVSDRLGTDMRDSAFIVIAFELGGPLGVFFAGYVSDKWFGTRRFPAAVIGLLCLSTLLFFFSSLTAGGGMLSIALLLFAIGFFLFGPDALICSVSAVDFGTKKGAGSAAGIINGMGSVGQILGMALPGVIAKYYGWNVLFYSLGGFILLAALILLPRWNAVPASAEKSN